MSNFTFFIHEIRLYKALTDENYSVAEDLAKYFIEMEDKIKDLSIYQEVIRTEIKNSTCIARKIPKFDHIDDSENSLALIEETNEDIENFSFEHINENKTEFTSPDKKSPILLKKLRKT